jgi:hypothetical protein
MIGIFFWRVNKNVGKMQKADWNKYSSRHKNPVPEKRTFS